MKKIAIELLPVLLFLLLIAGVSSCRKTSKPQNNRRNTQALQTIRFDSMVLDKKIYLIEGQKTPMNVFSLNFIYPSFFHGDSTLLKNVQNVFVTALFGQEYANFTPKVAVDSFYSHYKNEYLATTATDYKKAMLEGYDMNTWGDTYQKMKTDTVTSRKGIVSFRTQIDAYNGGAHDSRQVMYFNIDEKTGKLITEQDLFKTGYENKLIQAIINKLLKDNKLIQPEQLVEKGFFDLKELKSNKNFLLKKDSIMYVFNEYDIAPYIMGLIKVTIPNSKISDILK